MKHINYLLLGIFNVIHALFHLIQFIQSMLLLSVSFEEHENESLIEHILHNPFVNFIWLSIGIISLYLGIKDYLHHKKHKCH